MKKCFNIKKVGINRISGFLLTKTINTIWYTNNKSTIKRLTLYIYFKNNYSRFLTLKQAGKGKILLKNF